MTKDITQIEVDGLRRFISSDRTSDELKKSFKVVLDKYQVSHDKPLETKTEESKGIENEIDELKELLPFVDGEEKKDIENDINDLKELLNFL